MTVDERGVSRRGLLGLAAAGGAALMVGAAGVQSELLPGRSWVYRQLGIDGPAGTVPDVPPGRVESGEFVSQLRGGQRCGWTVATPPGRASDLPVVVVLHGRGTDHGFAFGDRLGLEYFLADAVADGVPPFAIASVDGGDTYWHPRESGEDSGAMVVDEFLPLLEKRGLRTDRIALYGWSMGGYGALRLGGILGPERVSAIVAVSPALWHDFEDTSPGAFDDADDFATETVFGREGLLADIPLRIDCGTADPFYAATRDYVDGLRPAPEGSFGRGGHDADYWRRVAPDELAFLGEALAQA